MNRLNEELLRVPNMELDDDNVSDLETAVNPDYADAVNEHEKIKNKLENDFKEQDKAKEDFIKDNHKREIKFSAPIGMKQMKLSESLFDIDVPITANVTANGNTVPFLNGAAKTEDVDPDLFQLDALEEDAAVLDRPTISWTEEEADKGVDLWTKVYDELDASMDPQDCKREVKAKRGERYQEVYPTNSGIQVYAATEAELDFAKRVADHYGLECHVKEDTNANTNEYYKYSLIIDIPME